jgi:hypothetical protein
VRSERPQEDALPRRRQRAREIKRCPSGPTLDVGAAPAVGGAVEVQERAAAHVEDAACFLHHARPGADGGEETGEVVEQLGRAVRHASSA